MKKRRINWSWGNPSFSAWVIDYPAGGLVLRRNHDPIRTGGRRCEGWDLWLDGRYLGAVGSRTFPELVTLSRRELSTLVRTDCCAQHRDFAFGAGSEPTTGKHGGRRPNAGRKPKGEAKRVRLSLTVDLETFTRLERVRGKTSRGQYIDKLMRTHRR
jgi:hypothetical protein